jgi:hypothetical protein
MPVSPDGDQDRPERSPDRRRASERVPPPAGAIRMPDPLGFGQQAGPLTLLHNPGPPGVVRQSMSGVEAILAMRARFATRTRASLHIVVYAGRGHGSHLPNRTTAALVDPLDDPATTDERRSSKLDSVQDDTRSMRLDRCLAHR